MKRRTEIKDKNKHVAADNIYFKEFEDHSDFYERWYAKFGEPQPRTLPADEFLNRMKEMIDFE